MLEREAFGRVVWEPACGDGAISEVLREAGYRVISSDLVDRGYGHVEDFLASRRKAESIVTNPPFKLAETFIRKALAVTTNKVAMLLRLAFLESQQRYRLFRETPLESVYVFSRRLSLYRGGVWELSCSEAKALLLGGRIKAIRGGHWPRERSAWEGRDRKCGGQWG